MEKISSKQFTETPYQQSPVSQVRAPTPDKVGQSTLKVDNPSCCLTSLFTSLGSLLSSLLYAIKNLFCRQSDKKQEEGSPLTTSSRSSTEDSTEKLGDKHSSALSDEVVEQRGSIPDFSEEDTSAARTPLTPTDYAAQMRNWGKEIDRVQQPQPSADPILPYKVAINGAKWAVTFGTQIQKADSDEAINRAIAKFIRENPNQSVYAVIINADQVQIRNCDALVKLNPTKIILKWGTCLAEEKGDRPEPYFDEKLANLIGWELTEEAIDIKNKSASEKFPMRIKRVTINNGFVRPIYIQQYDCPSIPEVLNEKLEEGQHRIYCIC